MSDSFEETIARIRSGTHAVVDVDAWLHNVALLRARAPGQGFMAVLKADGYGHGALELARAAEVAGVDIIGVARIAEGLQLRRHGIRLPVLVIGPPTLGDVGRALAANLMLSVGSEGALDATVAAARALRRRAAVHLKVDTGMHRYGFLPDAAVAVARRLAEQPDLDFDGVFTHFASADECAEEPTATQIARFDHVLGELERAGILPRWRHLANSAGVLTGRLGSGNLVRCGIATYGLSPSPEVPVSDAFRPALSVHSTVVRQGTISPGEGVSYNWTWRAQAPTPLAAVPVGYADGLPRVLANRGWFMIDGRRCPIRGRVCMDQTIVEVDARCQEGTPVTIVGDGTSGAMTPDEVAAMAGTNNYEVATRVMARVPRVYLRGGEPVAWELPLLDERGCR